MTWLFPPHMVHAYDHKGRRVPIRVGVTSEGVGVQVGSGRVLSLDKYNSVDMALSMRDFIRVKYR